MRDAPKQKEDGKGTRHRAHHIDRSRRHRRREEHRKKSRQQHEHRGPRRVADFQLVSGGDEFATVPETGCGLNCEEVYDRSDEPYCPSREIIESLVIHAAWIGPNGNRAENSKRKPLELSRK